MQYPRFLNNLLIQKIFLELENLGSTGHFASPQACEDIRRYGLGLWQRDFTQL